MTSTKRIDLFMGQIYTKRIDLCMGQVLPLIEAKVDFGVRVWSADRNVPFF